MYGIIRQNGKGSCFFFFRKIRPNFFLLVNLREFFFQFKGRGANKIKNKKL